MKHTLSIFVCLCLVLLCSCSKSEESLIQQSQIPETTISDPIQPSETTAGILPEPTEESMPDETEETIPVPTEPELIPLNVAPGSYTYRYTDETTGDYLDYYVFIPEGAVESMPVLVFLHGDGEVGNLPVLENFGPIAQARAIYGDEFPFIIISPCTREYSWIEDNIPATLKGLIDEAVETYAIDPQRIIISGHSRGAIGVWHMISVYGDYFAAAIPVSCGAQGYISFENCANVPIWAFVGTEGSNEARYLEEISNILIVIGKYGGESNLTVLDGASHGQTSTAAFTEDTFLWILEQ